MVTTTAQKNQECTVHTNFCTDEETLCYLNKYL